MLAFCYEYGLGAEVDLDKARDMFKQAGQSEKAEVDLDKARDMFKQAGQSEKEDNGYTVTDVTILPPEIKYLTVLNA